MILKCQMKTLLLLLLTLFMAGCTTAGQKVGRAGTKVLMVSGMSVVLIPVGAVAGGLLWCVAIPLYYGGGGTEPHPFDL